MPAVPSRHDHFPHGDAARCAAIARASAACAQDWRAADRAPGGLLAAMEALNAASAPPPVALAALEPWLDDRGWLRGRIERALALLARDPFARPPLRVAGGEAGAGGALVLAESGAIRLALHLRPFEAAAATPGTAIFTPGAAAIRVLVAGGAMLVRHRVAVSAAEEAGAFTAAAAARCTSAPPRRLARGQRLRLDTARESITLAGGRGDVLLLQLSVQPAALLPVRAYDLASGRLLGAASSARDGGFRGMALSLLGAMRRRDAVPLLLADSARGDFAARWHAMRELVALDPAAAAPRLAAMAAADPHGEVRRAAAATLALLAPASSPAAPAAPPDPALPDMRARCPA